MTTAATRTPGTSLTRSANSLDVQLRPNPAVPDLFFEAGWRDLERRSLHRNPFLSPSLLLTDREADSTNGSTQFLSVTDADGRWYSAGLFEVVSASRQIPAPHLQAVRGAHCFLNGLLLDPAQAGQTIGAIWTFLERQGLHGVSFPQFPVSSRLSDLLEAHCTAQQLAMTLDDIRHRATVHRDDAATEIGISEKRARSLQKGRKALSRLGRISMRFREASRDDQSAVDQFLALEALGWKGESRLALASCPADTKWFRKVAFSLSNQERMWFAELLVDDRVIASMCLFRAQSEYFAFKIGWDPQFERGCPGFLLAAEIRSRMNELPGCERIDGCARPGSFLDHVWPGRMPVGNAVFTTTRLGSVMATGTHWARGLLRKWRGRSEPAAAIPSQAADSEVGS